MGHATRQAVKKALRDRNTRPQTKLPREINAEAEQYHNLA
jgi:hypothetical protein